MEGRSSRRDTLCTNFDTLTLCVVPSNTVAPCTPTTAVEPILLAA